MKFWRALYILYLSFSKGRKDSTSLNHRRNDGAEFDFQLKSMSLRASREANAKAFACKFETLQPGGGTPKMAV